MGPTLDFVGTSKVHVAQPKEGLEKRQATINLCYNPGTGRQPRVGIIFRGTGARISGAERAAWDPRGFVQFQPKAWMDRPTAIEWVDGVWGPYVKEGGKEHLLYLDNLDAHVHMPFRALLKDAHRTLAWLLAPACTDLIQAVDAGAGEVLVVVYGQRQDARVAGCS
jgi:hypothetical protein